jgi:hypothetical protein
MAGILAFAEIACIAVESGEWRVELALYGLDEFLHTLCVDDPARARCFDSGAFDRFAGPIKREIRESEEWLAVVERLAAAAEHGSVDGGAVAAKSGRPPVQRNEQPTIRQRVDDYLARVTEKAGHKATRTDFWTVAGYKNRTDFERFQRDKKVTKTAKENFNRILEEMTPEQFSTALSQKKTALSKKKTSS